MKIFWTDTGNGEKISNQGYIVAANNIINEIQKHGLPIARKTTLISDDFSHLGIGHETKENLNKADLVISNTLPTDYTKIKKYNIGFTYWETTQIPDLWVSEMNKMDEIWTTSDFIKNVFIDSGVNVPVKSFKLGINEIIFRQIDPKITDKFIFIHDGSPSVRKNTETVINAFLKLFQNNYNYHLIIKSIGPTNARIKDGASIIGSVYKHPQISVIDDTITDQEVFNLYAEANCMLYPTSGEGWGMMPFQSIAMGIPTICTNFSACTEFANFSYPLDYKLSRENMPGIYKNAGMWAMPDFDDLCDKMLYIVNNYEEAKRKTKEGSDYIQNNMKWSDVGKDYYDRLCQILNHQKKKQF